MTRTTPLVWSALLAALLYATGLAAHDLSADNAAFVTNLNGVAIGPFVYLGAKHMLTGLDHLLFLFGVVFFLHRPRDIVLYVTLFTLGHSLTLLLGVWAQWQVSAHLVDAVIGLSVAYKAFENMDGFQQLFGVAPDTRLAVFVFGLCHGLGLATKLRDYVASGDGLLVNLVSFNVGVELGQVLALLLILLLLSRWRSSPGFTRQAFTANAVLMTAGFVLAGNQFVGYLFAE